MPLLLLLKGTLLAPISSAPLVILIYAVLILMLASALASILLRNTLYSVGAFAATMLLVAILYLTIAPFALFAVQLLIYTVASSLLLVWLLRDTTGLERTSIGPFSREWIVGAAVCAALLALLAVALGVTSWPATCCAPSIVAGFGASVTTTYVVGLATVIILLASAALGAGLILVGIGSPILPRDRGRAASSGTSRRRS